MGLGKVFQDQINETMARQSYNEEVRLIDYSCFASNPFQECCVHPDKPPPPPSPIRLPPRPEVKRAPMRHFCAYCGRRIAEDWLECPGCGAPP